VGLVISVSVREPDDSGCWTVVSVTGRAGLGDCASLRRLLGLEAARRPGQIVVDLSRLSSIDWWAALMLLWVGRVVGRRGGMLALASPQPAVARLLDFAGAEQVISVHGSVLEARASLAALTNSGGLR
jgi:anti-anti-sigma factor